MRRIQALAPTRIDFGGGWTDVPPYTTEQGGCVCNLAITRYAAARLVAREAGWEVNDDGTTRSAATIEALATGGAAALACAALRRAVLGPVSLTMRSDFPRGAGLGG